MLPWEGCQGASNACEAKSKGIPQMAKAKITDDITTVARDVVNRWDEIPQ
jgi:hypothetical protein